MNTKSLLGAAALALVASSPISAAPINLDFSFDGVSGTFYGLDNAVAGIQMASSYDVFGSFDSYVGIDTDDVAENEFLFIAGALEEVRFSDYRFLLGEASTGTLFLVGISSSLGLLSESSETAGVQGKINDGRVTFRIVSPLVAAVPLPAGGLLLLTGFAGFAGLKRWKKRAA